MSFGCAGTKAGSSALQPIEEGVVFTNYDNLEIKTALGGAVTIHDYEMNRIVEHVISGLKAKNPECFAEIGASCDRPSTLLMTINFTRYDKGNAFARAMLAGLGQMHIDAVVTIEDKETKKLLAKHEVSKTFAWGGLYGGTTRIEDIEPAFAEAIVDIVLQQEEKKEG